MRLFLFLVFVVLMRFGSGESVAADAGADGVKVVTDRATIQRWFAGWKTPVPPRRLVGNIYYVGASGVSSFLITAPEGHFLLDTGFDDMVPSIQKSVTQLGFRVEDIKLLLSSHAHVDHVGGHAEMKRLTGARVIASAEDAKILVSGGVDDFIPLPQDTIIYPPVIVDQIVSDGEGITLGGVTMTANITPGHTRGATTWTMEVVEGEQTLHVVFFSSTTINSGTSLVRTPPYPELLEDYKRTYARLRTLPCDIFLAPHGGQFAMAEKFARLDRGEQPNPLIDPAGWRTLITTAEAAFLEQIAAEQR